MILCCNISLHPLKPLQHIQPCTEVKRGIPLVQGRAAGLNTLWRREALKHHAKLRKMASISYNLCSLRLEKQLSLGLHLNFSWKKHQTNRFWTHLYSLCQDEKLIDPSGYGWLDQQGYFVLGCAWFCKHSFTEPWYNYRLQERVCSVPSLALTTACSPLLLPLLSQLSRTCPIGTRPGTGRCAHNIAQPGLPVISSWATYWYSPKKPPKVSEGLWHKTRASARLLTTYCFEVALQHSDDTTLPCLCAKGSPQRCSRSLLVQGKPLLGKIYSLVHWQYNSIKVKQHRAMD